MRNALVRERALGFVALLLGLPIAGALNHVIGFSVVDAIASPLKNPGLLVLATGCAIGLALGGLRAVRRTSAARGAN